MTITTRISILIVLYGALWIILRSVNSLVSFGSIHLFLDTVFLLFPALYLRLGEGATMALLMGFLVGSVRPVEFGQQALLFLLVFLGMRLWAMRLRREKPQHVIFLALFANTILFLGTWALANGYEQIGYATLGRMTQDYAVSTIALLFVAYRSVAWPYLALYYLGEDPGQRLPAE